MLERRVIILLKYSLNPLNICERNIYPSESDLQSLCLDCGNKVHHEEQFQDLPDNTTNETSKAVLELANSLQFICLVQATGQARPGLQSVAA